MTEGETKFRAFIDAIVDPALRNRVEDSAFTNAFEFPQEYPTEERRWEVALATAEECMDCARDYYPELFDSRAGRVMSAKLHRFDEITVKTELQPNGEYTAIDHDNYDLGSPVGWGFSEFSAIADLFEQMPRAESEREQRDRYADLHDHNRKLRVA